MSGIARILEEKIGFPPLLSELDKNFPPLAQKQI